MFPTFDFDKLFPDKTLIILRNTFNLLRTRTSTYCFGCLVMFLPALLAKTFLSFENSQLVLFICSRFYEVFVFLTIPLVIAYGYVRNVNILIYFFKNFFLPLTILGILQTFLYYYWILFPPMLVIYLFTSYTGNFMIIYKDINHTAFLNSMRFSARLIQKKFFWFLSNLLFIQVLISVPLFIILNYFRQPEPTDVELITNFSEKILHTANTFVELQNNPKIQWIIFCYQIVTSPFQAIFVTFLFFGALYQIDPEQIKIILYPKYSKKDKNVTPTDNSKIDNSEIE